MDVSAQSWIREPGHHVYCPVPWCRANTLRTARCGDVDGDYEGIHVARIKYAPKFQKLEQRRLDFYKSLGFENPELTASLIRINQDSIDMGFVKGRKGRRNP